MSREATEVDTSNSNAQDEPAGGVSDNGPSEENNTTKITPGSGSDTSIQSSPTRSAETSAAEESSPRSGRAKTASESHEGETDSTGQSTDISKHQRIPHNMPDIDALRAWIDERQTEQVPNPQGKITQIELVSWLQVP